MQTWARRLWNGYGIIRLHHTLVATFPSTRPITCFSFVLMCVDVRSLTVPAEQNLPARLPDRGVITRGNESKNLNQVDHDDTIPITIITQTPEEAHTRSSYQWGGWAQQRRYPLTLSTHSSATLVSVKLVLLTPQTTCNYKYANKLQCILLHLIRALTPDSNTRKLFAQTLG